MAARSTDAAAKVDEQAAPPADAPTDPPTGDQAPDAETATDAPEAPKSRAKAKIRPDLVGVVYLNDGRMLSAGDTVPDGVELGDHVLARGRGRSDSAKGDGDNAAGNQS